MIQEIDPTQTKRAAAFSLWMHAPMPMITLFKTLDVTPLVRYSRRTGCKFHMLLCWCIGRAASQTEAFYLLPVDQKLIQYDKLAISTVVPTADHAISTCDIPFSTDLSQFQQDYLNLTRRVHDTGEAYNLAEEYMVIGTSALSQYDIDGAVNLYAGFYNNPFLIWGKYKRAFSNVPCCSLFSSITHSWTVFLPHNSSPACNKKFKPFRRLPSYRKALRDNRPFRPSLRAFFAYFQREKPSLFFQNPWGPRSSTVLAAHRAASAMPSRRVPPCARAYSSAPEKLSPAPVVSTERQGSAS